jgi:hypothetical protein
MYCFKIITCTASKLVYALAVTYASFLLSLIVDYEHKRRFCRVSNFKDDDIFESGPHDSKHRQNSSCLSPHLLSIIFVCQCFRTSGAV